MRSGISLLMFGVVFLASGVVCRGEGSATPPNVLLIVADDLGWSDLSCYGGEIPTPHCARLAREGLQLTRFYSTGRCCPSRGALLTGQYPHRVGLGHMTIDLKRPGYRGRVDPDVPVLAQLLKAKGYATYLSGKWHLGTDDPTRHGFDEFYGTLVSAKTFWDPAHLLRLPAGRPRREYPAGTFYATDAVTDQALDFLDQARNETGKPWFLYLAYHAPHFPLHARLEDIARHASRYQVGWDQIRQARFARQVELGLFAETAQLSPRSPYWDYGEQHTGVNPGWDSLDAERRADLARRMAIYAAMVDRLDQNVGRVLKSLEEHAEADNTLVIFCSDNGACAEWDPHGFDISSSPQNILHTGDQLEQMGSAGTFHSVGSGWANASNTPFRMYKHYNHEGGISSPCLIRFPGRIQAAGRIDNTPAHLIDLVPTILGASGQTDLAGYPGKSLAPLFDQQSLPHRDLYFEHEGNRALLADPWKLVAWKSGDWELYDQRVDRVELKNMAGEHPEMVKELSARWERWARSLDVIPFPEDYGVQYLRQGSSGKP